MVCVSRASARAFVCVTGVRGMERGYFCFAHAHTRRARRDGRLLHLALLWLTAQCAKSILSPGQELRTRAKRTTSKQVVTTSQILLANVTPCNTQLATFGRNGINAVNSLPFLPALGLEDLEDCLRCAPHGGPHRRSEPRAQHGGRVVAVSPIAKMTSEVPLPPLQDRGVAPEAAKNALVRCARCFFLDSSLHDARRRA